MQHGKTIRMQHGEKWIPAKVLHKPQSPRSYLVESEQTGQKYRRNRRHLRATAVPTSQKGQRHESESVNTEEQRVSSDEQYTQGSRDSKRNPVKTRSGRTIKPLTTC